MKLYARLAAAPPSAFPWPRPRSADKLQDVLGAGKLRVGVLMDAAPWGFKDAKGEVPAWTSIWPG
ncbi:hypothetical protein WJ970_14035 [Achromobacter xylosoxidans]